MPHVNIKYFATDLSQAQESALLTAVTEAVVTTFGCEPGVVSIALEPVAADRWTDRVYRPEIEGRPELLRKVPNY